MGPVSTSEDVESSKHDVCHQGCNAGIPAGGSLFWWTCSLPMEHCKWGYNGAMAIMACGSGHTLTNDIIEVVPATDIWGGTLQDITFKVYFEDVKKLLHTGITSELAPLLSLPQLTVRQSAWEQMMDEKHPLSYNTGILSNLLQAITQLENGKFELMTLVLGKKPMMFIVDIMIKQCSQVGNQTLPPFIKGGNFIQVAWVVIKEMGKHLKINHMPWTQNPSGGAGRPSSMVTYEVWLNLGGKAALSINMHLTIYPGQQSSASLAYQVSKDIWAGNTHGDWSVMEVQLNLFDKVLHKVRLLAEWEISNIDGRGMLEYIVDAYQYVQNMYNGTKPLHQLAIICAVICAGLLPSIFCLKIGDYPSNKASYGEFIRNLEWVEWDWKAARHAGWFITMVSGFIICLFEAGLLIISTSSMGGLSLKRNTREWEVDDGVIECGSIRTQRKVSQQG
ncbi:hypothetical protein EDD15DRAFT_2193863 [Pisolithus albus]|nr:hypothetical protein EDD15DRAFT_2193863 [Pisolithus albus]